MAVGQQDGDRVQPVLGDDLVQLAVRRRCPGSMTMHCSPAPGATTQQLVAVTSDGKPAMSTAGTPLRAVDTVAQPIEGARRFRGRTARA